MDQYPSCFYELADGTRVVLPSMPIIRAGLTIPGFVERPDKHVVYVKWVKDQ
jgi:hypothetical protein